MDGEAERRAGLVANPSDWPGLTSWRAGAQPFVPAQRDLRMNCAVAQFTSSAPTVAGATKRGGGMAGGSRTGPTGSVLVFGRELRGQIARDGVGDCRHRRGCVGALGGGASCEPEHGLGGGSGFGGGFCERGRGFAGWGSGAGGGGVQESFGGGSWGGGGLCEFGGNCDAAAAVGGCFGNAAEGGAVGAGGGGDSFEYWIGLLPAE